VIYGIPKRSQIGRGMEIKNNLLENELAALSIGW
jgi:hypothetical protein